MTSPKGTQGFKAPEIELRDEYNGAAVDIFACGVILFVMVVHGIPFVTTTVGNNGDADFANLTKNSG